VQTLSDHQQYETIWLDEDGHPLANDEQERMRRENAREAARRARANRVFNARLALIAAFERQQLKRRDWISFAEIIEWRSRNRIDGSISEEKKQQTLDDLSREIAAGASFFEGGQSRVLFISPQYRVRRGILTDLSSAQEGNWVTRKRWLAWREIHSRSILRDEILILCWIPREICLNWCANLPFEPKPEWLERSRAISEARVINSEKTKLVGNQISAEFERWRNVKNRDKPRRNERDAFTLDLHHRG
jgi:hypothetical protein